MISATAVQSLILSQDKVTKNVSRKILIYQILQRIQGLKMLIGECWEYYGVSEVLCGHDAWMAPSGP